MALAKIIWVDDEIESLQSQKLFLENKDQQLAITKKIFDAFEKLSPRQKEIIYLKFYHNLSYEAVSEIMDINYQAARNLLSQAIAATPRGGEVRATAMATELGPALSVIDGGPALPEASRQDILRHRTDPTSFGRPAGIALVVADATAATLDATLEVREDDAGRAELWIVLPKS